MESLFVFILIIGSVIYFLWPRKKKINSGVVFDLAIEKFLCDRVPFYKNLQEDQRTLFKLRLKSFLESYSIEGIECEVNAELKTLIACSAITPVFYYPHWEYFNLSQILVYENLVDTYEIKEFNQKNIILGQVRPFQTKHIMLLSKQSIINAYANTSGKDNLGIHEFIHLIDEADGDIDGIPKSLLSKDLLKPWSHLMYKEIEKIKKGDSDINPYGITNHGEFFAVVSEYFFENPGKFKDKHPDLYSILTKIFSKKV